MAKDMGKVVVKVSLTNQLDLFAERFGKKQKPRRLEVDALVDTGATRLYLQPSVISRLGLKPVEEILSKTTNGMRVRKVYDPVRLEIMGRHGMFEVVDIDESVPNLIGQIPLEQLDLVVDSKNRRLIPNPEHPGGEMSEEFGIPWTGPQQAHPRKRPTQTKRNIK